MSGTLNPTLWFLVGNGGMDPYDSPLRSPIVSPKNPFPHSLLRTREPNVDSDATACILRSLKCAGTDLTQT